MKCHYCGSDATHTCVAVDLDKQGYNLNEHGYSRVPICTGHALQMAGTHTRRVEPIEEPAVVSHTTTGEQVPFCLVCGSVEIRLEHRGWNRDGMLGGAPTCQDCGEQSRFGWKMKEEPRDTEVHLLRRPGDTHGDDIRPDTTGTDARADMHGPRAHDASPILARPAGDYS